MALFTAKHLIFGAALVAVPLLIGAACSGGDFHAATDADAGGSGGSTAAGGSGNSSGGSGPIGSGGSSTGVMCDGPEDCDDSDLCTTDSCGAGECLAVPKCEDPLKCCEGNCGECCVDDDCLDEFECTQDICFAGSCTHVTDDSQCSESQYCSMTAGCRDREPCPGGTAAECEDGDPCTTDACVDMLCHHPDCEDPLICCPGIGCGMCCADSQCADDDPCTVDSCSGGSCQNRPLCDTSGGSVQCCIGPDGTSASCGTCCSLAECNDQVDCTHDACEQGTCQNTPDSGMCGNGMVCDVVRDCVPATQCNGNADCNDDIGCTRDSCVDGRCSNTADDSLCQGGSCVVQLGGCVQCTQDFQCYDGSDCTFDTCDLNSYTCSFNDGACGNLFCCGNRCQECCHSEQCSGVKPAGGGADLLPDGGIGGLCSWPECSVDGKCVIHTEICEFGVCCPPYGCGGDICPAI